MGAETISVYNRFVNAHRCFIVLVPLFLFACSSLDSMKISSSAFEHNGSIPSQYTCDGQSRIPPLAFSGIPEGTKSLALIHDDPDAPAGLWVHWIVWNINPESSGIHEGTLPSGALEGTNSWERVGYSAPCPPSGRHRYFFTLYALDTTLNLDLSAKKESLEKAMGDHILAKAILIGLYGRK